MTGLCGWLAPDGIPCETAVLERMGRMLGRHDKSPVQALTAAWGGIAMSSFSGAALFRNAQCLVAVWGDVRFKDAGLQRLALDRSPTEALCTAYADKGAPILQELEGSFAVALLRADGEALVAVDRLGTRPLCYALVGGALVFGSTLDAIAAFPGAHRMLNAQALYDYVYFHVIPAPTTIYEGWHRLLPASYLTFRRGASEVVSYWQMPFEEYDSRPFPELKTDFVNILRESVSKWAAKGQVGAFLSGGTDSSTIVGMLREVTEEAPRSYSIGFDAEGFDEMGYARIAARHFGTRHNEYYVTPADVVTAVPQLAAGYDQPFGNSSAVPTYYCAKLAKADGIEIMLGGDGGDELFGGNSRYATQYLYSLYSELPPGLRKRLELIAFALPPTMVGKMQRYIRSASMPMPERYDKYNLVEHFGPAIVFTSDFLASVDPDEPRAAMAAIYRQSRAQALINRMLAFDLKYTLADNDLPKVARSCELAGVDVGFPMLDDALVSFAARLAPGMKLKGTQLRYFFRQALRDFLPQEILTKKKHGFGLPFGAWLRAHRPLRDLALDSLSDLKSRAIIQPRFIDELLSVHVERHANYFSTMVWLLMMLEQWFARSSVAPADPADVHACASMEYVS